MNKIKKIGSVALLSMFSLSAFAAVNVGTTIVIPSNPIHSIIEMMVLIVTLLGSVFLIFGCVNLKKHSDNPQKVLLSKSLIFLTVGAILFVLGSTYILMQYTLFCDGSGHEEYSESILE